MTESTQDISLAQARSLMDSYAFDLGRDNVEKLLEYWLNLYHANWIRLATIEALYLGRYKAISIEHILNVWLRIGTPNPHFTYEFERLICRKLPKHLSDLSDLTATAVRSSANIADSATSDSLLDSDHSADSFNNVPHSVATVDLQEESLNLERAFKQPAKSISNQSLMSNWGMSYSPSWSDFATGNRIIHQFIPLPDVSSFFARLKTFGEEK